MNTSTRPLAPLDLLSIDVPAGRIEPAPDCYHVLDLHASQPVHASIRLDGRESQGAQRYGDINIVPAGFTGRWLFEAGANALLLPRTLCIRGQPGWSCDPPYASGTHTSSRLAGCSKTKGWLVIRAVVCGWRARLTRSPCASCGGRITRPDCRGYPNGQCRNGGCAEFATTLKRTWIRTYRFASWPRSPDSVFRTSKCCSGTRLGSLFTAM
jgi:hypothetical protein